MLQRNIFAKYSEYEIHLKNIKKLIENKIIRKDSSAENSQNCNSPSSINQQDKCIEEINSFYSIPKNIKSCTEIEVFIKEKERKIIDELRVQENLMKNINPRYKILKQIGTYNEVIGSGDLRTHEVRESQRFYRNL